jgi:uncharacterized membrane protein
MRPPPRNPNGNPSLDPEEERLNRKWRHRRRLAYVSLIAVITLTALVIVLASQDQAGVLADFQGLLITVAGGLLTLVGAYMGVATWYEVTR